ncbi:MAG: MlaD family protein [Desulfobacterota bacterium]|nr:MlaD family protein [Thermodesulfobacteriota bacterium]
MASKKTEFMVGAFVVVGISIAVLAFIWLGMSRFFEKGQYYVTYFNESVQGLDRDSPVKYRGVSIGRVQGITVAPDGNLIQVVMKIESGQRLEPDTVAQLKAVGITGSVFIELDRRKPGEPDRSPPLAFSSEYPVIGSKPSDIAMLLQSIEDIVRQVKALDVQGISDRLKQTLDTTNEMLAAADLKTNAGRLGSMIQAAGAAMTRLERTLASVERLANGNEQDISVAIKNLRTSLEQMTQLIQKSDALLQGSTTTLAVLQPHLLTTIQHLEQSSERLSQTLDLLAAQPSQILLGKPQTSRPEER